MPKRGYFNLYELIGRAPDGRQPDYRQNCLINMVKFGQQHLSTALPLRIHFRYCWLSSLRDSERAAGALSPTRVQHLMIDKPILIMVYATGSEYR
jgi:hypothetical protein